MTKETKSDHSQRFQSQIREVINRNSFVSLALKLGFNVFLPVYDNGIDFILHHDRENETRKVQLKARWTIDRKYLGRDIWIAFPAREDWYLMPHDEMVRSADRDGTTKSRSWKDSGLYSRPKLSTPTLAASAQYRFAAPPPREEFDAKAAFEDRITWKEGDIEIVSLGGGKTFSELDQEHRALRSRRGRSRGLNSGKVR